MFLNVVSPSPRLAVASAGRSEWDHRFQSAAGIPSVYQVKRCISTYSILCRIECVWLEGDRAPRVPGYVSVGSRRYAEWQNLAYQASTDEEVEVPASAEEDEPAVERPQYATPTAILKRPPGLTAEMMAASKCNPVKNIAEVCARDVHTVADDTCDNAIRRQMRKALDPRRLECTMSKVQSATTPAQSVSPKFW
ncbi:hypothetical protein PR003_g29929 [Phytophthora rubi]|uniref:Uncharacterized protein n=1 Tax=Phytophthora rubi TaxID=129364 RepID=A0A6A4BHJ0_9STRA|nr:hypothetical protein PR003_g29929 [Phytophthora rubi]